MDLFSAAQRMAHPFEIDTRLRDEPHQMPLASRGLIGDGFSAALVRVDGAIDWLCLPRFDSPAVFDQLIDARGGSTAITPRAERFQSLQRYDPDTNVLETLFRVPERGVVRVTDFMPWVDDPRAAVHEVHRRVQCVEGEVELDVTFDPRFDWGREEARFEVTDEGALARGPSGETFVAALGGGHRFTTRGRGLGTTIRLRAGDRRWMVLSWNAPRPEPIHAYRPFEHLRQTRSRWRHWVQELQYEGPWRHHVVRSALLLKMLLYAPTGAMVAAPTTSLPEWIGGVRNWDYRYSWTRDSAMALRATTLVGAQREAREFFHFVRETLDAHAELQIMYAIDGGPVPEESTLEQLSGFRGSTPVRIGNGARDQVQLDTAGALLDAAYAYERGGGSLTLRTWRRLGAVVDEVASRWREPDHGIWEPRDGKRHNVHSKLMSWVALDRGARLAPLFGDATKSESWRHAADSVRAEVCDRGYDAARGHFVAAYDHTHVDSALLLLPTSGILPADDPRVARTVDAIRRELGTGPYLHRYLTDDGVGGEEGAFVLCGFWMAEALAMAGRIEEAEDVFKAHAEASNHLGLLAEEIEPTTGELLGNFPQAFSHLGLINAAARIDLALRMRDEHGQGVPASWRSLRPSEPPEP
ncbi:MAG: glycoside hydrolase family 15 protein [Sandaracinus sp.]|nr:glycoside hydrolase family 15 protein [Sandaracinus sp.]